MIKNLKKLLPLAGLFLAVATLFCCDSTLIEDLDAIAKKGTEGTYIYKTIIQKQHIDDNNYDTETTTTETLNQPKSSTQLKQWISDAIDKNKTTGFILSNTPEVEHPEDNLYRLELMYDRVLYTLDFNENTTSIYEGTIPQSQTQKYEKLITLEFPELKLTNYMFLGWDENNTSASPAYTTDKREFTFYKDTTLYAIWQKGNATYTVYHYLNGLGLYQSQYTVLLSTETAAGFAGETTTATPFSFPGYEKYLNNIEPKGSIEQQTISADGTTQVVVYYDRNTFIINLDLAGGIFHDDEEPGWRPLEFYLLYGDDPAASVDTLKKFYKTGYTFTGWDPALPSFMDYTYDGTTYTAQWKADTYTLTYILNEGTMPEDHQSESEEITIETFLSPLPEPSRTGYTFAGWFTDPAFTEETQKTEISGATADITLYAKWDVINYTITYIVIVNGTETTFNGSPETYTIETGTITDLPVPEVNGYSFEGWYTDLTDGTQITEIASGSTGNITLYAKLTETSSGITITTPDVGFIEVTITPTDDTFDTTTISDTDIKFQVDTDTLISSEQMKLPLTCQWYLDGELKSTDSIDSTDSTVSTYTLDINHDSVTAGSHILTLIITDSTGKIATGTKQFVVIKN